MSAKVDELMALGVPAELAKAVGHVEYAGDPTNNVAAAYVGQTCHDTSNDDWYIAHGVATSAWKIFAT